MTDEFSADWLALREPCDSASRSRELALAFLAALPTSPRIVDLGAGRGSNARYLADLAAGTPKWRLIDRDRILLEQALALDKNFETECLDFARDLASIDFSKFDGVSGSALFDLVSREWFNDFLRAVGGLPLLLTLTVNGEFDWQPGDPVDDCIMSAFWRDMQRDKGFGAALGAAAPATMRALLEGAGYRVQTRPSPWCLGAEDTLLMQKLIEFVADAARRGCDVGIVDGWQARRQKLVALGKLNLSVGHVDVLALP